MRRFSLLITAFLILNVFTPHPAFSVGEKYELLDTSRSKCHAGKVNNPSDWDKCLVGAEMPSVKFEFISKQITPGAPLKIRLYFNFNLQPLQPLQQQVHNQVQHTQKHIIYNVDAKRTKKQDFIKPVDKIEKADTYLKLVNETLINDKGVRGAESLINDKRDLVPYKYHNKKNVPELKWASKAELYDISTFTESLTVLLGIQPIFINKKLLKDKSNLEERITILKNIYHFKHINKFNNNAIHCIYKILEYDKIILLN